MSTSAGPRATILIPSYNHARWVSAAVQSALDQSVRDIEVIVIDDGSSDESVARLGSLEDSRLTVWTQENQGLSRTLNRGLEAARGEWVKVLPSDDMMEPDCIERQLDAATSRGGGAAIFSLPTVIDGDGVPLLDPAPQAWFDSAARGRDEVLAGLIERNFLCAPGALFGRDLARAVGGFDASLVVAQDYDLWLKLLARGDAALVPERLVRVRWHGANQSYTPTDATEAERSTCVVRALEGMGLAAWTDVFRTACAGDSAQAKLVLAEALLRSGLPATRSFVAALLADRRAAEIAAQTSPPPRIGVRERVRRWLRPGKSAALHRPSRRASNALLSAPPDQIAPGRRAIDWLIVAPLPMEAPGASRSAALALALARCGHRVWYAARFGRREHAGVPAEARHLPLVELGWDLDTLRARIAASRDRLCLVLELPEGEVVALAREAGAHGARVMFDKSQLWDRASGAPWHHPADEQAAIDVADDLLAAAKDLVRNLASARRPVHYLPNAVDRSVFVPRAVSACRRVDSAHAVARPAESRPSDAGGGALTLVCATSLPEERLDWDVVRTVAELRPNWSIVLLGAAPAGLPRNVAVLGAKPQEALAASLAAADAFWLPLRRSPHNRVLSASEIFAALALHRPVIAPALPELANAPYVFRAEGAAATVAAAEQAAAAVAPESELEDFVARHTWESRARSLELIAARPTLEVVVLAGGTSPSGGLEECLDALLHFRDAGGYAVTVVEHGASAETLEWLRAREDAGEVRLVGSPLASVAAACNVGLRATKSELIAFLDPNQIARGPAWLTPAMDILVRERAIAAVGSRAGWIGDDGSVRAMVDDLPERGRGDAWGDPPRRDDIAYLSAPGLVLPRNVLVRAGGFDEAFASAELADVDLSFRLRDLGHGIAYCPDIDLEQRAPQRTRADDAAGVALLLERWRHRRAYFRASPRLI